MTFKTLLVITFGVYLLYYIGLIIYDHLRKGKVTDSDASEGERIDVSDFADSGEFTPKEIGGEADSAYMPPMDDEMDDSPEVESTPAEDYYNDDEPDFSTQEPPEEESPVHADGEDEGVLIIDGENAGVGIADESEADDASEDGTSSLGSMSEKQEIVTNNAGMTADTFLATLPQSADIEECQVMGQSLYEGLMAQGTRRMPH